MSEQMGRKAAAAPVSLLAAWLGLGLGHVVGCSGGQSRWERVAVTGTVTHDGKLARDGSISLRPLSPGGGPAAGATIRERVREPALADVSGY